MTRSLCHIRGSRRFCASARTAFRRIGICGDKLSCNVILTCNVMPARHSHCERREESGTEGEILRFAQDDDGVLRMTMGWVG